MSIKVQQLAPQIWEAINKSKNVLLHCHRDPDGDSVSSALSMMFALKNLGKNVTVLSGDSEKPDFLHMLPGFDQIKQATYADINPADFDLFIVLDSSDVSRITRKVPVVFPETMNVINIDHHESNTNFGKINLVDPTSPASCQILFDLFTSWKLEITPEMALGLYVGMFTDTGGFKYPPVSSETLLAASQCAKINPNFPKIIFEIENSNDPAWINFLGIALSEVKLYFSGHVAISQIPYSLIKEKNISLKSISKAEVSNMLKSVVGWNLGISMLEEEEGLVSLSIRTRDAEKFTVSKLAVALGGGGHPAAGGATIKKPFAEALQTVLKTIAEVFPELGNA